MLSRSSARLLRSTGTPVARAAAFNATRTFVTSVARMHAIPSSAPAAVVPSLGAQVNYDKDYKVVAPKDLAPGECLVEISHSGVCHTDLHAAKGDWPVKPMSPLIGGHEGVGKVVAIGADTVNSPVKVGDRVGIKWIADSCLNCEMCRRGFEMNCEQVKLSGYTVDGTFAKYIVSYTNSVTKIPDGLASDAAAPILCAGVTVYKGLKQSNTKSGDWIAIPGAGGGLGHLAVQYAKAMGLRVIAIDTGDAKEKLVKSYGADVWLDFKKTKDLVGEIQKAADGKGPHAALVVSASSGGYRQAIDYLRQCGTLVCVGLPDADIGANCFWTVFKQIRIQASYVGTRQDAIEALQFAADGKVACQFDVKDLSELQSVYDEMEAGKIAGRVVLEIK